MLKVANLYTINYGAISLGVSKWVKSSAELLHDKIRYLLENNFKYFFRFL